MDPAPRNVVLVLLDSLNRHMLGAYGSDEFDTPNLDAFARRALRFDRHHAGSLPCIPARHDLLCGALDFLWKPWGSIEVWEDALTHHLRLAGVTTMLVTDHPHLFETGGENYHTDFFAWEYLRGHETDPWRTRPDPSWAGAPALEAAPAPVERGYDRSRTWFRDEGDFPGPKTMRAAADWLRRDAPHHDRFFLFVDEFDPHEPFDTPAPYASMYDPDWDEPLIIWPPYQRRTVAEGHLTERGARHVRAMYGGKLTMIDRWFGELVGALDEADLWDDTAVIVTTDHGHYLGERDVFGKPPVPVYEPLGHIPMLVAWPRSRSGGTEPGVEPGSTEALTTSVDLFATIADVFDVAPPQRTHGRSLVPLVTGESTAVREWALCGYWAREVHVTDGRRKYARAPAGDNFPLSMWSNRWSTMPLPFPEIRIPRPDQRAWLDAMPGTGVPVIRQPFRPGDMLPWQAWGARFEGNLLYDLVEDPDEERNLAGTSLEGTYEELLRAALADVEAPDDQYERLGLS